MENEESFISEFKNIKLNLPENIMEAIQQIAIDNQYLSNKIDIDIQVVPNTGKSCGVSIFRTIISGEKIQNNNIVADKLVLICKIIRCNGNKALCDIMSFKREIFVYNELLPYFKKFQVDKGIKQDEGFFSFPACYVASYDEQINEGFIILEDLNEIAFTKCNKYKPATYAEVKVIMIALGRLHAISLAMKKQEPTIFEKFKLIDSLNKKFDDKDMLLDTVCTEAISTLENYEYHIKKEMQTFKTNYWKLMNVCRNSVQAEPFAVINHGDCWINNVMFSNKSYSSQLNLFLLNWENCHYSSPVLDLLYYIFTSTNQETRFEHYNNFIHIYYDSLVMYLQKLGGNAIHQFPISALQNQLKLFGKYGLGSAVFLITMHCRNETDIDSVLDEENDKNAFKYNERMSSIIRDTFNLGYL